MANSWVEQALRAEERGSKDAMILYAILAVAEELGNLNRRLANIQESYTMANGVTFKQVYQPEE